MFSTILLVSLCEFLCLLDIVFNPKFDQRSHFFKGTSIGSIYYYPRLLEETCQGHHYQNNSCSKGLTTNLLAIKS